MKKNINPNDQTIKSIEVPKKTGLLKFQFDKDEPHVAMVVNDFQNVALQLIYDKKTNSYNAIEIESPNGKKFKLFVEAVK